MPGPCACVHLVQATMQETRKLLEYWEIRENTPLEQIDRVKLDIKRMLSGAMKQSSGWGRFKTTP